MADQEFRRSSLDSLRLADAARGIVITVIAAVIGYFVLAPSGRAVSRFTMSMLVVGGCLQAAIVFARPLLARFERAHGLEGQVSPMAIHVSTLLADGLTVLLFALAVFGGIARSESGL